MNCGGLPYISHVCCVNYFERFLTVKMYVQPVFVLVFNNMGKDQAFFSAIWSPVREIFMYHSEDNGFTR